MTAPGDGGPTVLSPDDAFAAVGNETRMQILQTLGADEPLSFSELYDRVGMDDTGNFTYHLDRLVGHFVRKTGDEYALREPGNRIVQAVLSGAVTDAPVLEASRLDAPCPYCGQSIEIEFREERLLLRCPDCGGAYAGGDTDARHLEMHPPGTVAVLRLPPAGIAGKSPRAVLDAALDWTLIEFLALVSGRCPRCSGDIDWSLHTCENHDTSEGVCNTCQARHALRVDYRCTNCTHHEQAVPAGLHLILSVPELMSFVSTRDINPIMPSWEAHARIITYAEDVLIVDPLEVEFTFTLEGDELTLTVDDDLNVVDATNSTM